MSPLGNSAFGTERKIGDWTNRGRLTVRAWWNNSLLFYYLGGCRFAAERDRSGVPGGRAGLRKRGSRIPVMTDLGKILIGIGGLLVLIGVILLVAGRLHLPVGRLPGDIVYRGKHTTVFFPIVTSIVLSILLSLILWVIGRAGR